MRGTEITVARIATVQTISDSFKRHGILCVQCFVFSKNDIFIILGFKLTMPSAPLPGLPCNYFDDQMAFSYRGAYLKVAQLLVTYRFFLERNRITAHPLTRPVWNDNRAAHPSQRNHLIYRLQSIDYRCVTGSIRRVPGTVIAVPV